MLKIREEFVRNGERFRVLSDKVDKHRMAEAEMEAGTSRIEGIEGWIRKKRQQCIANR